MAYAEPADTSVSDHADTVASDPLYVRPAVEHSSPTAAHEPYEVQTAVQQICSVDVSELSDWISSVPLSEWPQQDPPGSPTHPAMVSDPLWNGFGQRTDAVVAAVLEECFPTGCTAFQRMLSAVVVGFPIPPHVDEQPDSWLCRVHVPLCSNPESVFVVGGSEYRLEVGSAYRVDTRVEHSVRNDGLTPRIHLMFDVRMPK